MERVFFAAGTILIRQSLPAEYDRGEMARCHNTDRWCGISGRLSMDGVEFVER